MVGRWQFLLGRPIFRGYVSLREGKELSVAQLHSFTGFAAKSDCDFFLCQKSPLKHVETVIWARLDLILQERNINRCICEVINGYILWIVLNRIDPTRWHSLGRNEQWLMLVNPSIRTQVWVWSQMTCRKAFSDKNLWILHWVAGQPVCFEMHLGIFWGMFWITKTPAALSIGAPFFESMAPCNGTSEEGIWTPPKNN